MKEYVILVDKKDNEIGIEEKLKAHQEGKLHRAFSIFVFDYSEKLLLQQRANEKYHCGGLWSNACCSHPRPNETLDDATHRRLREEMGFDCKLDEIFSIIYKIKLNNSLTEHEFDHVFIGKYDGKINPNKNEVENFKWIGIEDLKKDISRSPNKYTPWLKIILNRTYLKN